MNPANVVQHNLAALQHPRQQGLVHQQQSNSPRTQSHSFQPTPQGSYASQGPSQQALAPQQYQSPYIGSVPQQHQPGETTFFGAHPSPYSSHSTAPSYASSEPGEGMATHATMNRQHYPPISSYQTPQSNSPASIHSPQTDAHGRHMYAMPAPVMQQQMFYHQPAYHVQHPQYPQHTSASYHPPVATAPPPLMSYQQAQQQAQQHAQQQQHQQQQAQAHAQAQAQAQHHQQQQHHHQHPQHQQQPHHQLQHHQIQQPQHHPSQPQPRVVETKPSLAALQQPQSAILAPQGPSQTPSPHSVDPASQGLPGALPGANGSAAPGPIPATTPQVVKTDQNGVQWIMFEYSRDRVKMPYTIRCDVESINTEELSPEFKSANCVYPRACCDKEQYKGNRLHYETECNAVGWALAQLNPPLREKRGLIQRAVDSWRNSNRDPRLRSRRVRRMAKVQTRKASLAGGQQPSPPSGSSVASQNAQVANDYAPSHHHQPPPKREEAVSASALPTPRTSQSFYPTYPVPQNHVAGGIPPLHNPMNPPHSAMSTLSSSNEEDQEGHKRKLFGDIPEAKRRKFILVDDSQRGTKVRVRVSLDQVKMDDMPDAHLKINSVYPRSYYPRHIGSPLESSHAQPNWNDEDDGLGASSTLPTKGRTIVPVPLMDGSEAKMPVPRMTKSKRNKEVALNEIGYRMSWGQARAFNGRTLFLQRSLDAYRNKMCSTMHNAGQDVSSVAPHFETRIGKRRWADARKRYGRSESP